jgi:hypothetical protein
MKYKVSVIIILAMTAMAYAQQNDDVLPYRQVPEYPEAYTAGTVVARVIDGLGFRYYWATEGLGEADKDLRLSEDSRSILELMQHIHGLSLMILNTAKKVSNDRGNLPRTPADIDELRAQTLRNLQASAQVFSGRVDLTDYPVVITTPEGSVNYEFWHQLNGPLEDAVWHSGQIAILRRAKGIPMPEGVDFFMGTAKK